MPKSSQLPPGFPLRENLEYYKPVQREIVQIAIHSQSKRDDLQYTWYFAEALDEDNGTFYYTMGDYIDIKGWYRTPRGNTDSCHICWVFKYSIDQLLL